MMLAGVDKCFFTSRKVSPEDKDDVFFFFWNLWNDSISKISPSYFRVACREGFLNSENTIEEQYSLICPVTEISTQWGSKTWVFIFYFCKHVSKTRRNLDSLLYRKAESMRLSLSMIRILSEYYYFEILHRTMVKSWKNITRMRVNNFSSSNFWLQKWLYFFKVRFFKFLWEKFFPRWLYLDRHNYFFESLK